MVLTVFLRTLNTQNVEMDYIPWNLLTLYINSIVLVFQNIKEVIMVQNWPDNFIVIIAEQWEEGDVYGP